MQPAKFSTKESSLSVNQFILKMIRKEKFYAVPLFLILRKYEFKKSLNIIGGTICFILAIYFRQIDKQAVDIIPFGTHFLWHIFSGIGAYLLADYLYFLRKRELSNNELILN